MKTMRCLVNEANLLRIVSYNVDAGIYEFEMRATGKTVKGRYSFIYV
jgi:hypothetical protein